MRFSILASMLLVTVGTSGSTARGGDRVAADEAGDVQSTPLAELPVLAPEVAAGVARCGEGAVCVPASESAAEACGLALPLLAAEGRIVWEASCAALPVATQGERPALRSAHLFRIHQADSVAHYVAVLESDRGYDRVVDLFAEAVMAGAELQVDFPRFAIVDSLAGGPALWVERRMRTTLRARADDLTWRRDATDLGLCAVTGGSARCLSPLPLAARSSELRAAREHVLTDYALDVRIARGELAVRRRSGTLPRSLAPLLGRHTLEQLEGQLARVVDGD